MPIQFIGDLIKFLFWKYFRFAIAASPPAVTGAAARLLASFMSIAFGRRKGIVQSELSRCGLTLDGTLKRAFKVQLGSQLKMLYLPKLNSGNIARYMDVKGLEALDRALEKGRGVILLNPHFGPFMLVMPALGHRGYKLNQVALQGHHILGQRRGLDKMIYESKFDAIEKNMPVNFINAAGNQLALRDVLRALRNNELVLFASTGRAGKTWHEVEFLGRRATFNITPFRIAFNEGSPLLPIFLFDVNPYAELVIEKPIEVNDDDTPEKLVEKYVAVLENYVKRHPDHFAFYLYEMRKQSWWDDHPFFSDYPADEGSRIKRPSHGMEHIDGHGKVKNDS